MPLYEYKCDACGRVDEVIQAMNGPHEHFCEICGEPARRLFPAGVRTVVDFRSGWDPGMGIYVDTKKQRETELRSRDLEKAW